MRTLTFIFVTTAFLGILSPARAFIIVMQPYGELFDKSELVVIACPMTKTTDTDEKSYIGIGTVDIHGNSPYFDLGVETTFRVVKVVKGDATIKQFVLHHYRDPSPGPMVGPAFVSFDPSQSRNFLLFLSKEEDGRFAPAGGQINPGADNTISEISGDCAGS